METPDRKLKRTNLWFAALWFVFGLFILARTYIADEHHAIIHAKHGAAFDSWQGYIGGALFLIVSACLLASGFPTRNRNDI